jgi:protein gp37
MAENSKIEWTDHTVNLWWGCSKVHTGCKNCYAEYLSDTRYKNELWGEKNKRKLIKSAFKDLDKYQKQAKSEDRLLKIFCGSMMDIFEDSKQLLNYTEEFQSTSDLRLRLFNKISNGEYDNLIFLFLTKRPENIKLSVPTSWIGNAPKNVWFGTSISNQETANIYRNRLVEYKHNNLFLSIEPQVDDIYSIDLTYINWVIQGGESGHSKRPFNIEWAYKMKEFCEHTKTPYFFKQIDKIQSIPNDLQIRQFPNFNYIKQEINV